MVHKNGANFMMQINHIGIKAMNKEGLYMLQVLYLLMGKIEIQKR